MITKFINAEGRECEIEDIISFMDLIESGKIREDTLLYCDQELTWKKAYEFKDFQILSSNIKRKRKANPVLPSRKANLGFWGKTLLKKKVVFLYLFIMFSIILGGQTILKTYISISKTHLGDRNDVQATPLLEQINTHLGKLQEDIIKMNREIGQKEIETLLTPEALGDPVNIIIAPIKLDNASHIIDKYEALFKKHCQKLDEEASQLCTSEILKAKYHRWKESTLPNLLEIFETKRALVSEVKSLVDFLRAKQGKYWVKNKQIFFLSQNDAQIYQHHMEVIATLINKERSLSKIVYSDYSI